MENTNEITVVTTNDLAGYKVVETFGEVFGLIALGGRT